MADRTRSYEFSQREESTGGKTTVYEDITGAIHEITVDPLATNVIKSVQKSFWQNSPVSPIKVGDTFSISRGELGRVLIGPDYSFPTTSFRCDSVKVSDDMVSLENGRRRAWLVTITGTEKSADQPSTSGSAFRRSLTVSKSINGESVRTINGSYLILRRSTTPIAQLELTAYSKSETPPVRVGGTYSAGGATFTIVGTSASEISVEENGQLIDKIWQHTITGEA